MKLKNITALILCAVLLTMGSVYATWDYVSYQDVTTVMKDMSAVTITDKVVSSLATGSINVVTDTVKIQIHNVGEHTGGLRAEGNIVITFNPEPEAPADIKANGIDMKYELSFKTNPQYKGADIFKIETASGTTDVTKSHTITADDLLTMIGLNQEIKLTTEADYDAFKQALTANPPVLEISVSQNV